MGFHFPTIVNRMKDAIKLRKSGLFMPIPSSNNLGPDGMILPQKNGAASPKGGGINGTGRPALQPKTANQQKRGTSQPKKAKARLIPGADGLSAYLVLDRELTAEEKAVAAERFSIPTEWVLSEAEYKTNTGKTLSWLPPLPELTTGELYGVITNAQRALAEINVKVEAAIEKYKAENAGGKRGAYVTAKMREDFEAQARAEVLAPFRPEVAEEEWNQRLIAAQEDIGELGLTDRNAKEAHTAHLLAAKYQKRAIARQGPYGEQSRPSEQSGAFRPSPSA
jgi:hypothetical protein